jgi:hypothetical protein
MLLVRLILNLEWCYNNFFLNLDMVRRIISLEKKLDEQVKEYCINYELTVSELAVFLLNKHFLRVRK